MPVIEAAVLGVVQGLTEFIPISSSGHLVLVPEALGWGQPGLAFDVLLHAGSLIALLIYFSGELIDLTRGAIQGDRASRRLVGLLIIGNVPAAIAGLVWGDYFEEAFKDASAAAIQLGLTAIILVGAELILRYHQRRTANTGGGLRKMEDMNVLDASVVGVAQAVSILPGISRSGSTIGAGLAMSISRDDAARFAFLLAIPALFGAMLIQLPELDGASLGVPAAVIGFLSSLVFSYAAIWGLIRYLKRNTLYPFAAYCVVAAIVFYALV